jgi:hypothetical protein
MAFSAAASPSLVLSRLGAQNLGATPWANFVRLYAAEVMVSYKRASILAPLVKQKTISKGKSTTFPLLGRTTAEYFTPGYEITGGQIRAGERQVTIDDLLISAQSIYSLDEAMNYYDVRSQYSAEAGLALARESDRNIARMLMKAALSTDYTSAGNLIQAYTQFDEEDFTANQQIGDVSGDELDPSALVYAIQMAVKILKKKDIPTDGLSIVLAPDQYFALTDPRDANKLTYMNTQYGGVGNVAGFTVPKIGGIPVYMSNNFDPTDLFNTSTGVSTGQLPLASTVGSGRTAAYDMPVAYLPTAKKIKGMIFSKDAVCSVSLLGMQVESEYQMQYQRTLMLAKKAEGHNVLRPAGAVALYSVS